MPVLKEFNQKNQILILPDGISYLIPFETLIDNENHFLVEKINVKYGQSINLLHHLSLRTYSSQRKDLLAFGGAVYKGTEQSKHQKTFNLTPEWIFYLSEKVEKLMETDSSLFEIYDTLGLTSWQNIPNTEKEVNAICQLSKNADLVTGFLVNEDYIRKLDHSGLLLNYKILHFSTHGIAVPELPELSAIILSDTQRINYDNYLNYREIASLHVNADLVVLSACETGRGKIYSGEGVVGLPQAFLLAGAKKTIVSLWQVDDFSTAEFMIEMYKHLLSDKKSPEASINLVKRTFIDNPKLNHPFYWSPFVLFGN